MQTDFIYEMTVDKDPSLYFFFTSDLQLSSPMQLKILQPKRDT